jgi:soluble lytic murein transglycosylase-like protein
MQPKRAALCLFVFVAFVLGSSASSQAIESYIDRAPRKIGVRPHFSMQIELLLIADRLAAEAGLPEELVHAVVRVESNWDQSMTGFAGEIGLMQIKPETARLMGFTGHSDELYDPETNIRFGVRYLAEAWRRAGGDLCVTALKYNGGHNANKMTDAGNHYCDKLRTVMAAAQTS